MLYNIETLKDGLKGYWFAWVGQNATTGTPHQTTGNLNMYGDFIAFRSKEKRDQYVANFSSNNPSEFCKPVTVNTGRKYKLGVSMLHYLEHLHFVVENTLCEY